MTLDCVDLIDDIIEDLLSYHHKLYMNGAIKEANTVAKCIFIVQKRDEQEPKIGHWIEERIYPPLSDAQITVYRCSCCDLHFNGVSNYCPNCGAKMESEAQE